MSPHYYRLAPFHHLLFPLGAFVARAQACLDALAALCRVAISTVSDGPVAQARCLQSPLSLYRGLLDSGIGGVTPLFGIPLVPRLTPPPALRAQCRVEPLAERVARPSTGRRPSSVAVPRSHVTSYLLSF